MAIELAKTNMYVAAGPHAGAVLIAKTNMYVAETGDPEGPTLEERVTKVSLQLPVQGPTSLRATKAAVQLPAVGPVELRATAANLTLPVEQETTHRVTKAAVQVVCAGRPELAYVRAWTFTLDGHEYYVLQLQDLTLVYDLHSGQWYNWGTAGRELWRAQIGIDWNANLGAINGGLTGLGATSILVGDYALGSLYFLNTGLAEDTDPDGTPDLIPFQRLVYGQLPLRGPTYVDCPAVELSGSLGETSGAKDMTVTLKFSDDDGHNYVNAGTVTVPASNYETVVSWRSLGSFKGPGRLFRVEDWGAIWRVDGLDIPDGKE